MEVLLDMIHQFDYSILVQISDSMRGGFSDTVWTVITSLGTAARFGLFLQSCFCSSAKRGVPVLQCWPPC